MDTSFDLKKAIEAYDPHDVGLSIAALPEQFEEARKSFKGFALKKKKWTNVVVCAMGGSGIGVDMLRSAYGEFFSVPVTLVHDYTLPGFVSSSTLVIVVSYSGGTEEMLSCMRDAKKRKASVVTISSGGALEKESKRKNIPHIVFTTENNPSGQPRIGTAYTLGLVYLVLRKAGLLKRLTPNLFSEVKKVHVNTAHALQWAQANHGQSYLLIAAEHLSGSAHLMSNQLNECAKAFAPFFHIPELNHHLLEGLGSLTNAQNHWTVVFFESHSYSKKIQKRIDVTIQVLEKQGFTVKSLEFTGSKVEQCLRALAFGSWWSYYDAILAKRDPSLIPWVDYFKQRLA